MGVAQRSSSTTRARALWLTRFGPQPPVFATDLLDRVLAASDARRDQAGVRQAAQALGVLRAQQGHAVAGLVEDMTALRSLLEDNRYSVRLVDAALTAATSAYVDELTAILASRATRDPLTGLPNRAALSEALEHEIRATPRLSPPALLLIDLHGFKGVNDTDGHLAGDAVLRGVATVLTDVARTSDVACRLGGDEFAIVLPRTTQRQAMTVARRLLSAPRTAETLSSPHKRVTLSVGIGWLSDAQSVDEIVAVADA